MSVSLVPIAVALVPIEPKFSFTAATKLVAEVFRFAMVPIAVALSAISVSFEVMLFVLASISPSFEVMLFVLASISPSFEVLLFVLASYVCFVSTYSSCVSSY